MKIRHRPTLLTERRAGPMTKKKATIASKDGKVTITLRGSEDAAEFVKLVGENGTILFLSIVAYRGTARDIAGVDDARCYELLLMSEYCADALNALLDAQREAEKIVEEINK